MTSVLPTDNLQVYMAQTGVFAISTGDDIKKKVVTQIKTMHSLRIGPCFLPIVHCARIRGMPSDSLLQMRIIRQSLLFSPPLLHPPIPRVPTRKIRLSAIGQTAYPPLHIIMDGILSACHSSLYSGKIAQAKMIANTAYKCSIPILTPSIVFHLMSIYQCPMEATVAPTIKWLPLRLQSDPLPPISFKHLCRKVPLGVQLP